MTGAPTFSFVIGTTTKTATWYAGSGTDTLLFSYAVAGGTAGDFDDDGISWLSGALGNAIGIVQAGGTRRPSLTYAAQPALTDHKVDGRTAPAATATVTPAVTSIPRLKSIRIADGGHLRAAGDYRDRGHRERGGGGHWRSRVPVHDRH